jgi:hypothetical protein
MVVSGATMPVLFMPPAVLSTTPISVSVASFTPGRVVAPGFDPGGANPHVEAPVPINIAPAIKVVAMKIPVETPKPIATG